MAPGRRNPEKDDLRLAHVWEAIPKVLVQKVALCLPWIVDPETGPNLDYHKEALAGRPSEKLGESKGRTVGPLAMHIAIDKHI